MDIAEARNRIADSIEDARLFRTEADITVRANPPEGTAVINCDWALNPAIPPYETRCRMVTIMIDQRAMRRYMAANEARQAMYGEAIARRIKLRLTAGGYRETDPCDPAFIVHVGADVLKESETTVETTRPSAGPAASRHPPR